MILRWCSVLLNRTMQLLMVRQYRMCFLIRMLKIMYGNCLQNDSIVLIRLLLRESGLNSRHRRIPLCYTVTSVVTCCISFRLLVLFVITSLCCRWNIIQFKWNWVRQGLRTRNSARRPNWWRQEPANDKKKRCCGTSRLLTYTSTNFNDQKHF